MWRDFFEPEKLMTGDVFLIDWVPGVGKTTVKGVPQGGPFKGAEFFQCADAHLAGFRAADWKLKDALLFGKAWPDLRPLTTTNGARPVLM
jgi:hypothetical protein